MIREGHGRAGQHLLKERQELNPEQRRNAQEQKPRKGQQAEETQCHRRSGIMEPTGAQESAKKAQDRPLQRLLSSKRCAPTMRRTAFPLSRARHTQAHSVLRPPPRGSRKRWWPAQKRASRTGTREAPRPERAEGAYPTAHLQAVAQPRPQQAASPGGCGPGGHVVLQPGP